MFAAAYIAIRDLHEDPETGELDGGPVVSESWERSPQGETGWTMLDVTGGLIAAYYIGLIVGPPDRGLFALFGPRDLLESIDGAMPAREMYRRRSEPEAGRMMRAWPVWRVTDAKGVRSRRRFSVPLAAGLPSTTSPWDGDIVELRWPALDATLAGHPLPQRLEDEPDRNP